MQDAYGDAIGGAASPCTLNGGVFRAEASDEGAPGRVLGAPQFVGGPVHGLGQTFLAVSGEGFRLGVDKGHVAGNVVGCGG